MSTNSVAVAMSGGVDSAVSALLLRERGYAVTGVTLSMFGDTDGAEKARAVADAVGIPFAVIDASACFDKQVIAPFIECYRQGKTPNPCIACNRFVKFGLLYEWAMANGFDKLATGHYARIVESDGTYHLKKAADPAKDQSYVLYMLSQEQLSHLCFPLGEMTKSEVRALAAEHGFVSAHQKESQDICFVPDGDYAGFIARRMGETPKEGQFTDETGRVLGTHRGLIAYTVGQRKGLGLSLPAPLYVCRKDVKSNTVVLASEDRLFSDTLTATDVCWTAEPPKEPLRVKAKVRYRQPAQWATVEPNGGTAQVRFDEPQRAIAAGQAVVFYDDDTVLGGGTIDG